jgi:hypothetical protein
VAERRTTDRRKGAREMRVDVTRLEFENLSHMVKILTERIMDLQRSLNDLRVKMRS